MIANAYPRDPVPQREYFPTQNGGDIPSHDNEGHTVLHDRIYNEELPKQLIECGACIELLGTCPLRSHHCRSASRMETRLWVNSLINYGAVIDKETFEMTIKSGSLGIIELLVSRINGYLDINEALTGDGKTALRLAVCRDIDIIELLLEYGAESSAKDSQSQTALHYASISGHTGDILGLLISHGAELQARGNLGRTPLHLAGIYTAQAGEYH